jgi:hypothetical protein
MPGLYYHMTLTNATAARSAPASGAAVGRLQLDAAQEQATIDIVP